MKPRTKIITVEGKRVKVRRLKNGESRKRGDFVWIEVEDKDGVVATSFGFMYHIYPVEGTYDLCITLPNGWEMPEINRGTMEGCFAEAHEHHEALCAAIEEAIIARAGGYSMPCLNCGGIGEIKHQISEDDYESSQCLCCNACGNIYVIPAPKPEESK